MQPVLLDYLMHVRDSLFRKNLYIDLSGNHKKSYTLPFCVSIAKCAIKIINIGSYMLKPTHTLCCFNEFIGVSWNSSAAIKSFYEALARGDIKLLFRKHGVCVSTYWVNERAREKMQKSNFINFLHVQQQFRCLSRAYCTKL